MWCMTSHGIPGFHKWLESQAYIGIFLPAFVFLCLSPSSQMWIMAGVFDLELHEGVGDDEEISEDEFFAADENFQVGQI